MLRAILEEFRDRRTKENKLYSTKTISSKSKARASEKQKSIWPHHIDRHLGEAAIKVQFPVYPGLHEVINHYRLLSILSPTRQPPLWHSGHPLGMSPACLNWCQQRTSASSSYSQSLPLGWSDYCLTSKEAHPASPGLELHLPVASQPRLEGLTGKQPWLGCSSRLSASASCCCELAKGQCSKLLPRPCICQGRQGSGCAGSAGHLLLRSCSWLSRQVTSPAQCGKLGTVAPQQDWQK